MKRFYLTLIANVLLAIVLAFLTLQTLQLIRHAGHSEALGWLTLYTGPLPSLLLFSLLMFLLAVDSLWAMFFVLWIIRYVFHIKPKDNTIYLP